MSIIKKGHEIFILEFSFLALVDARINHRQQATPSTLRFLHDNPATQYITQIAEALCELQKSSVTDNERRRNKANKLAKDLQEYVIEYVKELLKKRSGLSIKKEDGTFTELNLHEFNDFPDRLGKIKRASIALIRCNPLLTKPNTEIVFDVSVIPQLVL